MPTCQNDLQKHTLYINTLKFSFSNKRIPASNMKRTYITLIHCPNKIKEDTRMEYYLLPVEESEALEIERALRKINYDVDDRASIWGKEEISKVINSMTKENAQNLILEFLPDPIGEKFANVYGLNLGQPSSSLNLKR